MFADDVDILPKSNFQFDIFSYENLGICAFLKAQLAMQSDPSHWRRARRQSGEYRRPFTSLDVGRSCHVTGVTSQREAPLPLSPRFRNGEQRQFELIRFDL